MGDPPAIFGATVAVGRELLRTKLLGPGPFERAMARVPAADRDHYLGASSMSWVRVAAIHEVLAACAAETKVDPREMNRTLTRAVTDQHFRGPWKIFFRFTTDEALLSRGPVMYGKTYSRGRMVIETLANGRIVFDVVDYPNVDELVVLEGLAVATEQALVVAGRKNPTMTVRPTRDGGHFEGTWG